METALTFEILFIGVVNIGLLYLLMRHCKHASKYHNNKDKGSNDIFFRDLLSMFFLLMLLFLINLLSPDFINYVIMYYKSR